jgi:hypothetical protein
MTRIDRVSLLICLSAFVAAVFISINVYEAMPHIEDEIAFVWQAQVIERGRLSVPTPQPNPDSFLVSFVVDYQGQRFGKYPIGWPVLLAVAQKLHARHLLNPFLTALSIWWIYLLVKGLLDEKTALLAAFLTAASPFVMLNAGTLLSHPWSLLLSVVFCAAWLDAFGPTNPRLPARATRSLPTITAGLALGVLALTRPWTAVGVFLPFAAHSLIIIVTGSHQARFRLAAIGLIAVGLSVLLFVWQLAVTGDPCLNPYTLWWPYDRVGFGPGHGLNPGGHSLEYATDNTLFSLYALNTDLFGWPVISWLFMPFGLLVLWKNRRAWLVISVLPSLIAAYALYWAPSSTYGPRYYYEGIFSAVLLSAAGIRWLAGGLPDTAWGGSWSRRIRLVITITTAGLLISANLLYYLPARVGAMRGASYISAACQEPFRSDRARQPVPALVFVHLQDHWAEYGCLIDLTSPFMDSPFVIAISRGEAVDSRVTRAFPGRAILQYYPFPPRLEQALEAAEPE